MATKQKWLEIYQIENGKTYEGIHKSTNKIVGLYKKMGNTLYYNDSLHNKWTSSRSEYNALLALYFVEKPEIPWDKLPIDTRLVIGVSTPNCRLRYYAGLNNNGIPCFFAHGSTSWSTEEPKIPISDLDSVKLSNFENLSELIKE